jgi:hypothetical protein
MKKCYAIIRINRVEGSEPKVSLVMDDDTGLQYLSFASREEARAWIRRLEGRTSHFEPRERGSPSYTLAEVGSESFLDAYKRTQVSAESSIPAPQGVGIQSRRRA